MPRHASKLALFLEHFNEVTAELKAKGIKPGIWCDFLFDNRDTPEVKAMAKTVTAWFWDYRTSDYRAVINECRWQGEMAVFDELGYEQIMASSSESYLDSSYLPRYADHGPNVVWGSRFARERNYRGHCVTSWSMHCSPKCTQYALWEAAAKVWENPKIDGRKALDDACVKYYGMPLVTMEKLTNWERDFADFQGEEWGRFIKPSMPAPKTAFKGMVKIVRNQIAEEGNDYASEMATEIAWYRRQVKSGLKDMGEAKTELGAVIKEGAELQLCYLDVLEAALKGERYPDIPEARSAKYYGLEQAPKSAALSAKITWSGFYGELK